MSLKLFRSTGYSSILTPGESRLATHPCWLILAVSVWIGFVCNVVLWRELRSPDGGIGLSRALLAGAVLAGASGALLSIFGWRRTLKQAATLLLLLAACGAAGIGVQGLSLNGNLRDLSFLALVVPAWPGLLRWQFPALLASLGLVPMAWVWQLQLRRLPGPAQLTSNLIGFLIGVGVLGVSAWLLSLTA